ncbi:MAG: hypothetical protein ACQETA_04350 [Bacteroidota bacterium]
MADNINHYFNQVAGSQVTEERLSWNDSIKRELINFLKASEDIYSTNITGVNYLGQISSNDSLVKIFTWNIPTSPGDNLYNCIIYNRNSDSLFVLEADRGLQDLSTDEVIESTGWYGSLYYDIQPVGQKGDAGYILLGFDPDNVNVNSKVVEIMHFNDNGEPLFGKEIIMAHDDMLKRMIFKYSPLATMILRFNTSRSKIVFDHLSPSSGQYEGVYKYYGPDFSFDALEIRDGKLVLVEDIDPREDR